MIRALSILAAVAALAVSAAPLASAGTSKKPPSPTFLDPIQPTSVGFSLKPKAGPSMARIGGKMHLEGVSIGAGKDRGWFHRTGGDGRNTATGHSAGLAPDFGIYPSLRKAPPKPQGLGVTYFKGELVGIEPSLRKALPKPRGMSREFQIGRDVIELVDRRDDKTALIVPQQRRQMLLAVRHSCHDAALTLRLAFCGCRAARLTFPVKCGIL